MSRVVDITDKLNFEENPKLKIKNTEIEINSDAPTMLQVMQTVGAGKNITPHEVITAYELIFPKKSREKLEEIQDEQGRKLNFEGLQVIIEEAINLITGPEVKGE